MGLEIVRSRFTTNNQTGETPMLMPTINWAEVQHTQPTGGLGMVPQPHAQQQPAGPPPVPRYDGVGMQQHAQQGTEQPLMIPAMNHEPRGIVLPPLAKPQLPVENSGEGPMLMPPSWE